MKMKFTFLTVLFSAGIISAQNGFNCISEQAYEQQLKTWTEFKKNQETLEKETQVRIKHPQMKTAAGPKIIPVVFHIIHTGTSGNISDAQVIDQVNILNKEFKRLQADTSQTPAAFKPLAAPFDVEFRLATLDPGGMCTNGIVRIYHDLATCSFVWDDVKKLSYWPSNMYLNVWLVESMHYPGNASCNGGGYAQYPGGNPLTDGVVMRSDLISSIGTSATNGGWGNFQGRYLIHELGHWFNLRHIWGNANCGNDLVNDTPPHETSNSGCPTFPHKPNNTCGGGPNGEMFTNYMDYTHGTCLNMFSVGQVARMDAAINSTVSGRSNLWSPGNLIATGTNDTYTYPAPCPAVPDILPYSSLVVCAGDSVKFTDYSYGGKKTSRLWNFFGNGSTSTTDSIVKVKYNNPGIYDVSLTTFYLSDTKSATFMNKVYVLDPLANPNYTMPISDSFENNTDFKNNWVRVNHNNDSTWRQFTNTAFTGTACVGINNFYNPGPLKDELISPAYSLNAASTATLSFRVFFATKSADDYDKLQVLSSSDCGKTWSIKYTRYANTNLKTITNAVTNNYFPPAGSAEWRKESINLFNNWGNNPVRFKFLFTSGGGNNILIDDINIEDTVSFISVPELSKSGEFKIYPNPVQDNFEISLNLSQPSEVEVMLTDIVGKTLIVKTYSLEEGQTILPVQTSALAEGLYLIQVRSKGTILHSQKIIISR